MERQDIITYLLNMRDFTPSYSKEQYKAYLESFDTETLKDKLDHENAWACYKSECEAFDGVYLQVGAVIKIDSLQYQDSDYHNYWAVVLKITPETKDNKALIDVYLSDGVRCVITTYNIKSIIGTVDYDLVGIGKDRHEKEVIKFIEKALKN